MRILLTDGSHMNALGAMRHLKEHEIDLLHHKKSAPAYSRYCNKLIICPNVNNQEEYFEFLYHHVQNNKYDILIPVGVLSSYICSKYYPQLSQYVRVEIAPLKSFEIAVNKTATYKFCEEHGILHPKTYDQLADVKFPAIIKGAGEVKGKFPVLYVKDSEELNQKLELLKQSHPYLELKDLIIQDQIIGEPYGFFCLYQNGELKRAICQRRIREYPFTGGHATSAETNDDDTMMGLGKNVFDKLKWHGVGMAEYKRALDGSYYLIEINPKFWTALELHILAGMHFPEYLLQMNKEELEPNFNYRKKSFVWLFAKEGELYRILNRPRDLFRVIRDIPRSYTDLHIDDLKPTVVLFLYWVISLFRPKFRSL
jgi:predicted ATP-grasp superfamily ATP-dependent carboligase